MNVCKVASRIRLRKGYVLPFGKLLMDGVALC